MKIDLIILPLYILFNFNFQCKQLLQPTVTTIVCFNYFTANNAAKPIPSINAAAISIAV